MSRTDATSLPPADEVVGRALSAASGRDCIVVVEDRYDADVRFANNTTTTNGVRRDRRVTVVAIMDQGGQLSVGTASAGGAPDIEALVARAEDDGRAAPPADDAAALITGGPDEGGSFGAEIATTDLGVFAGVLDELGASFEEAARAGNRLAGFATHEVATVHLASSTGLRRRYVDRQGSLELVARSSDGVRSAWAARGTEDFTDVSLGDLDARLRTRLDWARRRVELPAGRYEVIIPPDAVADLVIELYGAMDGRDAEDGGSVFSAPGGGTRLGEQLTEVPFRLHGDPAAPGLGCPPVLVTTSSGTSVSVFDNGSPLSDTDWMVSGRLANLRYHRAGAQRSHVAFAPAIDNLLLEVPGASATLDELIASTERGLLLTCLWYIREVDPATLLLTGLTRDGVYLVEHGEVVGAVNNFRFNESPLDMLARTVAAGASERCISREWGEWMGRTAMPALRISEFNMSSVSQAS